MMQLHLHCCCVWRRGEPWRAPSPRSGRRRRSSPLWLPIWTPFLLSSSQRAKKEKEPGRKKTIWSQNVAITYGNSWIKSLTIVSPNCLLLLTLHLGPIFSRAISNNKEGRERERERWADVRLVRRLSVVTANWISAIGAWRAFDSTQTRDLHGPCETKIYKTLNTIIVIKKYNHQIKNL